MSMQNYPIGIQTFSDIIEDDFVYIDKTELIHQLIRKKGYYFLSRPRRFGKSLTLSTIASIFRCERELFAGLAIEKTDYNWQKHPVIHIDLGDVESVSEKNLMLFLHYELQRNAKNLDISLPGQGNPDYPIGLAFSALIEAAGSNCPAVLLIDEYDKPLVNVLDSPELFERNRNIMAGFYRVIKKLDPYLRFCMLSGISRFGRLSLFSELNNLEEITYDDAYATLCGYTEDELEQYFSEELQTANRPLMQEWYNGYRFGADNTEAVYNPFCLLNYFKKHNRIQGYWINSGTTSLLVKLAQRNNYLPTDLQNASTTETSQAVYNPEQISFESLLLQTGYLTIDHVQLEENNLTYYLRVPNREVQGALNDTFLEALTGKDIARSSAVLRAVYNALIQTDQDSLQEIIHSVGAGVPNEWYINIKEKAKFEALYCAVLYILFYVMPKVQLRAEESTALGRAGLGLELEEAGKIFVVEVKVDSTADEAMKQILEKRYLDKYKESSAKASAKASAKTSAKTNGKELYALACVFSSKERNITEVSIARLERLEQGWVLQ